MPGSWLVMSPKGKTCIPKGQFFVKAVFARLIQAQPEQCALPIFVATVSTQYRQLILSVHRP